MHSIDKNFKYKDERGNNYGIKETFTQHLAHEVVQAVVHRERYGWPPDSQWGMFQPTRPEETEKAAVKEDR